VKSLFLKTRSCADLENEAPGLFNRLDRVTRLSIKMGISPSQSD
jgi:hypothetical protein